MSAVCLSKLEGPDSGRILIVSGNDGVRETIAGAIGTTGWPVIEARDWLEALLQAYVNDIGLAVIPEEMQGIGVRELACLLRRVQPGLRVLLPADTSSLTGGPAGAQEDDVRYLRKPLTTNQLLAETIGALGRFGTPKPF